MSKISLTLTHSVALGPKARRWLEFASEIASKELPREAKTSVLSLSICGDARMRRLNREFRQKDRTTDVLSFPLQNEIRAGEFELGPAPSELLLGDLVISLPKARAQAAEFGITLEEELVHLFFHGFLHLLGYDHELSRREAHLMELKEAKLLKVFSQQKKKITK